ncbi:MAG: alpha/beta hydrolase [Clostridiales bacterium]|jgi:pimeloyl-ACP methyl ester carboxylesterase|nr:alpha/beta hydrolase [Clostridiales bacterium]
MINHIIKGEKGNGDIIFLHGFGGSAVSFSYAASFFCKKYRTTAVDFYGFGDTPPPEKPLTVDDYAGSVEELMYYYGMNGAVLVAHSFGGRIAIKLAAENPKIKKLILADSAGIIPKRTAAYYFRVYLYKFLKKLRIKIKLGSRDYRSLSGVMQKTFVNIVNTDMTPYLGKIKCPTLIVWGENDKETPLYMGEIMRGKIGNSALVVFKNCGHFAYLEESYKFLKLAEEFLAKDDADMPFGDRRV